MDTNTLLKELREITGAGVMDIKSAMEEAGGDKDKAIDILRKKGQAKVAKKADRAASEGIIESYIHAGGRVGVLVEVNTETDFVARTDDFKMLAKEIALHIAASNPLYVNISDVPAEVIEKEKEIYKEQVTGKPENVTAQILEGKIAKYYEEVCLMEQPFVKNPDIRVKDLVAENVAKLGENIVIRRFSRFNLGN
jgi:elongation factor Ts